MIFMTSLPLRRSRLWVPPVVSLMQRRFARSITSATHSLEGCRSFLHGAEDDVDTTASNTEEKQQGDPTAGESAPFPWRHERVENMLPRLTIGSDEQKNLIPTPVGNIEFCLARMFLGVGWWDGMIAHRWKHELADSVTYAFTKSLASLLSNVYRVPLSQISSSFTPAGSDITVPQVVFHFPPKEEGNSDNKDDYCRNISDMMPRPIRQVFESAHEKSGKHLRIQLEITPKQSAFHRLFGLPFVSRQKVETDKDFLLNIFFKRDKMTDEYVVADQSHAINTYLSHITGHQSRGETKIKTTVAAEVLVICDEIFKVWDAETGELLQGSSSEEESKDAKTSGDDDDIFLGREVAHVVTMERDFEIEIKDGFPYNFDYVSKSNWQITDIDDSTGPQKWYHVLVPSPESKSSDKNI
eukprot:CAMPEP_0198136798 /NCGR_PEP_ID=MMETSP1443-20131203/394_1 /TAXON_ID=186043 /ORGANISM="Entomoneis sp., Strain CCMP2396" /LENGTH=411 /DNA_ID=CAMNT_0043798075 /DNA_START=13 /DNA_END=1248 /DNA_ORIENTATION=+